MPLPLWFAFSVQVPVATLVTVVPLTVQTPDVAELPAALRITGFNDEEVLAGEEGDPEQLGTDT